MDFSLPPDFAARVLDCELRLETEPTAVLIHEVVNLYSRGIEYYEVIQDSKYLDYQNRLHHLLAKPKLIAILNAGARHTSPPADLSFKKKKFDKKRSRLAKQLSAKLSPSPLGQKRVCHEMIGKAEHDIKFLVQEAKYNVVSQENALDKRIASRKQVRDCLLYTSPSPRDS